MAELISLRGRNALSPFRIDKLLTSLATTRVRGLAAEFWHFVQTTRALSVPERDTLERILAYGPHSPDRADPGELYLVIPRPGTISPWASKATDIARNCGLASIERIERGVAFRIMTGDGKVLEDTDRAALLPQIHDRMTEAVYGSLDDASRLFSHVAPRQLATIDLAARGRSAIEDANSALGLALSVDEIDYLADYFGPKNARRDPPDVELMMFAQANSEHCRHKIFNAEWIIDGRRQEHSLFAMIRHTHSVSPQGTVMAYADNAAIAHGRRVRRFYAGADGHYGARWEATDYVIKVETHNHPTAIAPFAGAATGSGGEIRDEGATGRGAKPKAGLTGFTVSHLRIPALAQPWELPEAPPSSALAVSSSRQDQGDADCDARSAEYWIGTPQRIATPLEIMLQGPIGGASFNNEFGRPNLLGYFRTFEQQVGGQVRGYHKPMMIAGGVGDIAARHAHKRALPQGALIVQLGGPGMLIGMGGGAASSMSTGSNPVDLDFDSVQRGNAEMQRRAQEVIDRCWQMGDANPILSIHDVGAGGLSNALPELAHGGSAGARIDLRSVPSEEPGMSPREIWCNEAQERYVLAIRAEALEGFRALCVRVRCPFAVVGRATRDDRLIVEDPEFANRPVDMELSVLLGKPPKMTRDVAHVGRELPAFDPSGIDLREAAYRVLQFPAVADKTFLVTIGDRTVGGLCSRDSMVGPWQVPVADVAVTLMDFDAYAGEAIAMGERTPLALIDARASGRMAIGEALTNLAAAGIEGLGEVKLSANWMAAAGHPGEDAALYDTVRAVAMELCPALGVSIPVGKDSLSMQTRWDSKEVVAPLSLIVSAFAPVEDARDTLTPELHTDVDETELLLIDLGCGKNRLGGSILAQTFAAGYGTECPDVDDPALLKAFFAAIQALRPLILAYHDRSDGGLFATVCEMAFAGHCGVTVNLDPLAFDAAADDVDAFKRNTGEQLAGRARELVLAALYNEELGAVIQVRARDRANVMQVLREAGLGGYSHVIGQLNTRDEIRFMRNNQPVYANKRDHLQRIWSELTYRMQALRDHPESAREEYDRIIDPNDSGLSMDLKFEIKPVAISTGA